MQAELVLDAQAQLGEGAIWDRRDDCLWWVDIPAGRLHRFNGCRDQAFDLGQPIGTVVPRRRGGLLIALHHGIAAFDPQTGKLDVLHDPEKDNPDNRFNDGKCDPAGRFWAGTLSMSRKPAAGNLYCLETDGSLRRVLTGVTTSNGLAWSLDGATMYYIDTATRAVAAFDFDPETADISNRRIAAAVPEELGRPDGMTLDAEGMLWVAHWEGAMVGRWDPRSGQLIARVDVPALHVSSCAFGGPDLATLYITTARGRLSPEQLPKYPQAGGLFAVRPGVRGLPAFEYGG